MTKSYLFHLENSLTGEIFDIYASTLLEAKNIVCKTRGGEPQDWFEIIPCF